MKKLLLILFLAILAFSALGYWFYTNSLPVSAKNEYTTFNISSGASATQIGSNLFKKGLIKNPIAFKIYIQFTGMSDRMQVGDYRLSPSFSLFQIVNTLSKAPLEIKVTIQEGLRREEIAAKFAKSLDKDSSFTLEFMEASRDYEGYLFPDTYLFPSTATPGAIISKMRQNYNAKVSSLKSESTKLSDYELLILASLIERETKTGAERPIVAGILMNRINENWPLQIDATVQYAVSSAKCKNSPLSCNWWEPIGSADLEFNSPFNTYKNQGLPPSPIANPGLTAIRAAYNPEDSDYFFYIHDPQGKIHYARTLSEQNANIDTYLR
jgi:UPF0755 protein